MDEYCECKIQRLFLQLFEIIYLDQPWTWIEFDTKQSFRLVQIDVQKAQVERKTCEKRRKWKIPVTQNCPK